MKDTDALISDYSSAAYDYLHLDKPIAYTMDDAKEYKLGFIVEDPFSLMAGHIIYNQKDFMKFIEDVLEEKDPYKFERKNLYDRVFKFHDGDSSKRIVEFLEI